MIAGLVLMIPLLIRAVYTDVKTGKIENKLILMGLIMGVLLKYVTGGVTGVLEGLKMAFFITAALFLLFIIGGMGAGDIKLITVLSVIFPEQCVAVVVAAFIIAGIMVVGRMIHRAIRGKRVYIPGETIHFSIPIFLAFAGVMIFNI